MEAFFIYFLKSCGIILLFLACYKFFLSRETFHTGNRYFLFSGLVLAIFLPLISYTKIVWVEISSLNIPSAEKIVPEVTDVVPEIELSSVLFAIYIIGILFAAIRLSVQFLSLRKVFKNSRIVLKGKFKVLESNKPLQPFSFFNSIIYHRESHSEEDIKAILAHEKIHSRQYHSIDILAMHLFAIFQWCNPFIYLYKFYLKENLEFIADAKTLSATIQKENYQYLLVKSSLGEKHFAFVNPFFNSSIKKRIVMLNKKKSKKGNSIKYALVIPLLIGFVLLFNVETVAKINTISPHVISANQDQELTDPKVYSISKDASDDEIKALKKKIKKENGKLSIKNLKRNSDNEITTISVTYKSNEGGYVTGNYDEDDNINTIHFGQNEKGGLFISTDDTNLSQLKKQDVGRNDKFNEVVYDKEKSGDFPILTTLNYKSSRVPLYLVNGVETPLRTLSFINPADIENMTVLKESLSTSIYGEKGRNGVVNITTKDSLHSYLNELKPSTNSIFNFTANLDSVRTFKPKLNGYLKVPELKRLDNDQIGSSLEKSPWKVSAVLSPKNQDKMSASELHAYYQEAAPENLQQDIEIALIIVDGKEMSKEEFDKIPADEIESISILKDESAEKRYGEKGKKGVIEVTLKKKDIVIGGADRNPLIFIDGKESSKEAMQNLDQDKIKSISILKDEQAIKKYGQKGKDGVVEIITKKK